MYQDNRVISCLHFSQPQLNNDLQAETVLKTRDDLCA